MDYQRTPGTSAYLKMSHRKQLTRISTLVIACLLIIEQVHAMCYNECDPDAKFICEKVITNITKCNEKSSCQTISVKMIKKCEPRYKGDETIERKCEEWPTDENQLQNQFLTLPVINSKRGIWYWNMYCALCNYDDEFKFEDPVLLPITVQRCGLSAYVNFIFAFNESIVHQYKNVLCYGNTSRIISEDSLKSDYHCNKTPSYTELRDPSYRTFGKYCNDHSSIYCPKLPFRNDLICSYRSGISKYCEYDWFLFEGINFAYGENGDIYVASFYKNKFSREEYRNLTGNKGVIYVCGEEWNRVKLPLKILTVFSYFISIVFFALYITLNWSKQRMQNLRDRTIFSLCIAQMMYSFFILNSEFPMFYGTCIVSQFVFYYAGFCSALWNVVVLYEHSRVIYFLIRNLELPDEVGSKKYLIYCCLCWVIPALPTVFSLFVISAVGEKSTCPKIKDYSLVHCGYDRKSHDYAGVFLDMVPENYTVCSNIVTLGSIGVMLAIAYLYRLYYTIGYSERDKWSIFKKTSLICVVTSSHFVFNWLERISEYFEDGLLEVLFTMCYSLMGVSIFCVCYYDKDIVNEMLVMCNLRKPSSSENIEIIEQERDE